jgi:hypothetical protein
MVQEGRGHAAIDVWAIGEAALWSVSLVCGAGGDRAPSRSGLLHAGGRSPARASGIDNLQRAAAQRRHPKRRPRVSCDDSAMARRARCSPPKAGEACAQCGVKNLCRGTVGWRRCGSERGSCSRSWIRSPVTSRSNWAKDKRTFRVNRPMLVVVLNAWVTETNDT